MKKRFLCVFLTAILVLTGLPLSVLAYGHSATTPLPDGIYKSWKQFDSRWGDVVIGVDPWTDSNGVLHKEETIGHAGCLISSMAILARSYGLTLSDGTEIDPGTLGTALYDGGSCRYLTEGGGTRYTTAFDAVIPGIRFVQFSQPSSPVTAISALLADTEKEYIIIVGVNSATHYVAVDYVNGGDVMICDPGYSRSRLSEYTFYCMLVFEVDEQYVDSGTVIPGEPVWVVTEPDGVRVRSGAGLLYDRLGVYSCGTRFTVSETAEADGYLWGKTADGWCALQMLDLSEIYCVCLNEDQYSVTYHTNGGTGAPEKQYKIAGEPLTLASEIPVKDGYRFLGWSRDPSAVSAEFAPGGQYREDATMVLYAVWMEEKELFGFGIDVSAYQGDVDWEAVAADGISFVILRAGTSNGKDTRFEENYLGAKAAGLYVGSYFYSYALDEESVLADAVLFAEWLSGKTFDFPVFLDLETEEQSLLPDGALGALAESFLSFMTDAGYFCGVYSSESWFEDWLDREQLGGRDALWVAKWTESGTLSQNMSECYGLYQYSETGRVAGINCTVDLDVCYIDYPSLLQNWNGNRDAFPLPDAGLQIVNGILFGGKVGLTVAEWQTMFDGEVSFLDVQGVSLGADDIVLTGCTVNCGGRSYTVGVRGDVNGDGRVELRDYMMVKRYVLGTFELEGAAYYAGCLSGNKITATDYMKLKRYVLGTYDIYVS